MLHDIKYLASKERANFVKQQFKFNCKTDGLKRKTVKTIINTFKSVLVSLYGGQFHFPSLGMLSRSFGTSLEVIFTPLPSFSTSV